ncbi:hypothetical protein ABT324_19590 [Saccharopolyspora sp. NPDC000359]|uniref:hypothetical protein n=1 Tax=Saccharopolyspora sp. NPDC000359 TaxID=3154251 RepID=UPI00332403DB
MRLEDPAQVVGVRGRQREPTWHRGRADLVDVRNVGEPGEGVESHDPPERVVRLAEPAHGRERGEVPTVPDPELHDHAGHVDHHPVELVHRQQVGHLLAAQEQRQRVDEVRRGQRSLLDQLGEPFLHRHLGDRIVREDPGVATGTGRGSGVHPVRLASRGT